MLKSMTGYGRTISQEPDWVQSWEIRSVNGRHLDIKWRLPQPARPMEMALERIVKERAIRGRVSISLHLQVGRADVLGLSFNRALAEAMLAEVEKLAAGMDFPFRPDFTRLLGMSFLWEDESSEPDPTLARSLEQGLRAALEDWDESRTTEGRALQRDLSMRLIRLREWQGLLKDRAPDIKAERAEAMLERIQGMLEPRGVEMDENRLLQEIAIQADRLDVTEELTRLAAHLDRFEELLAATDDVGKRLDFLLQECFREINTCGTKSQDTQVSRIVVDFKAELEKCREQVQNLE